ncbi:MAG: TM2 domain-containing protein [Erysipelotrichaceae bacterium]|nr:TM2 domain-containing protein [Erysipelotrichaceae bacterium]
MKEINLNAYMAANSKYFNASSLPAIRNALKNLPDDSAVTLESAELKDPTIVLVISLFVGGLGIDRFMIGDIGMGVAKLLTLGGCGILSIIDWFTIMKRTRTVNYEKFMSHLAVTAPEAGGFAESYDAQSVQIAQQNF